ncbi:MAG: hypothetical protein LBN29_04905 [Mediterranea sp.]|jgi:hypothetical protein|nr:hypothetical protein [Mediterranea sp.]
MIRIITTLPVAKYLLELVRVLYEKGYSGFEKGYSGFEDSANRYVEELVANIYANLPSKMKKPAPPYFDRYGRDLMYAAFRRNKTTQWYVFFQVFREKGNIAYLIRYIDNNHRIARLL